MLIAELQRLGKRRPLRPRTGRPGCRSRTASIPSRSARSRTLYVDVDQASSSTGRQIRRRRRMMAKISTQGSSPQLLGRAEARGGLGAEEDLARMRRRRRLCAARSVGLRQDHAAQPDLGPAAADRGAHPLRRPGCHGGDSREAQHRAGVPVPGHLRHDDRSTTISPFRCATGASRSRKSTGGCAKSRDCSNSTTSSSGAPPA